MLQNIQMTEAFCDHKDHQGQQISSLCRRSLCKAKSACCQKCVIQFHQECVKHIVFFDDVPKLVSTINNLETIFEDLISKISQMRESIHKALDGLQSFIKVYLDLPNLGNLNKFGDLIRSNLSNLVPQLLGQTQKEISDKFTKLFLSILQMEPEELAQEWIKEYKEYFGKDNCKALDCVERAIQLAPNKEDYLNNKGWCLWEFKKYEDAVECFNKSIQIKPNSPAYIKKACSLAELNRFTEAINCLEEGLEYFPFHPLFITLLDSYKLKLKQ